MRRKSGKETPEVFLLQKENCYRGEKTGVAFPCERLASSISLRVFPVLFSLVTGEDSRWLIEGRDGGYEQSLFNHQCLIFVSSIVRE